MNTTLITGASSGIGAAFARKLAKRGRNVLLVARSEDKLIALCNEIGRVSGIRAQYIMMDLSEPDAAARLLEETQKRELLIDMLINNAGFGSMGDFTRLELKTELEMIDLNVKSLVDLTDEVSDADARPPPGNDHQRRFDRWFSGGTVYGHVRSDESFCVVVFRSVGGREPDHTESACWRCVRV